MCYERDIWEHFMDGVALPKHLFHKQNIILLECLLYNKLKNNYKKRYFITLYEYV